MKRISPERKASVLAKLLPPWNMTVAAVAQMDGISESTLYNWCNQAKAEMVEYCCKKGLSPEQLPQWKQTLLQTTPATDDKTALKQS